MSFTIIIIIVSSSGGGGGGGDCLLTSFFRVSYCQDNTFKHAATNSIFFSFHRVVSIILLAMQYLKFICLR